MQKVIPWSTTHKLGKHIFSPQALIGKSNMYAHFHLHYVAIRPTEEASIVQSHCEALLLGLGHAEQ